MSEGQGRRGFQFGLRKLLLWTAAVALYLGILSLIGFEPCLSVSATCYVIPVGIVRAKYGPEVACLCSIGVLSIPAILMAVYVLWCGFRAVLDGLCGPLEAVGALLPLLFFWAACCLLGYVVFLFVHAVYSAVEWTDNLLETKTGPRD